MSSSKTVSSTTLLVVAASAAVSGCFDTAATPFPPGLEPLDATNVASFPPAVDGDPCPEALVLARAGEVGRATVVHARGCVHAPLDVVWRAIQNPQTGRDPSSTDPPFMVIAAPSPDECDGDYETQLHVDDVVDVDFRLCWRHEVIEGTDEAPLLTATRWQKVWGTTIITSLEGSLLARPHPDDPSITRIEYEYHFDAIIDDPERMEAYLTAIFGRLRDDAHGVMLLPADY
ncbi:MAG: hypothetical protein U0353_19740 [Sandaracinus sp.]